MIDNRELKLFWKYIKDYFEENGMGFYLYQLENPDDDNSLRLVEANRIAETITGISSDEIIGKRILENFPNLIEQNIPKLCADAVRETKILDFGEIKYSDHRISEKICKVKAYPQILNHLIVSLQDITEVIQTSNAVKEIEETYKSYIDSGSVLIWTSDNEGKSKYFNKVWQEYTGKSLNDLVNGCWTEDIHPDDFKKRQNIFLSSIITKTKFNINFRLRNKDGEYRWFQEECSPCYDNKKNFMGYIGHCIDINERFKMQEALLNEKNMLRTLIDNIPDTIYVKDEQCKKLISNKADLNLFGLKIEDVIGKTDFELLPKDVAERCYKDDMDVIKNKKQVLNREEKIINLKGETEWLLTTKVPLIDAQGETIGLVGIGHNITKRKEMKIALEESEARYKKIFEFHSAIKLLIDCKTEKIIDANRSAVKFYGFSKKALNNKYYRELLVQGDDNNSSLCNMLKKSNHTESKHLLSDNTIKDVEIYSSKIEVFGKEIMHLIIHDITDRKLLESQLVQAQKLESIGQLAAGIAHEINTPSQYVGDNITFLNEAFNSLFKLSELFDKSIILIKDKNEFHQEYLDIIKIRDTLDLDFFINEIPEAIKQANEGMSRITKIVKAMKSFSHPSIENKVAVNINELIESTVIVSRNEWKYHSTLNTEYSSELPEILCYPTEFNQVILNLIVNSAHAIEEKFKDTDKLSGIIKIKTEKQGNRVLITLSDNGAGIPEKIKKMVFNPFFTTKVVGKGTGQGLSIAHDIIVNKHKGSIDFQSVENEGTTFYILLPFD